MEDRKGKGKAREVDDKMDVDVVMGEYPTEGVIGRSAKPPSTRTICIKPLASRVEDLMQVDVNVNMKDEEMPSICTECSTRNMPCILNPGHYTCGFCAGEEDEM